MSDGFEFEFEFELEFEFEFECKFEFEFELEFEFEFESQFQMSLRRTSHEEGRGGRKHNRPLKSHSAVFGLAGGFRVPSARDARRSVE